jgi:hypothetical protein
MIGWRSLWNRFFQGLVASFLTILQIYARAEVPPELWFETSSDGVHAVLPTANFRHYTLEKSRNLQDWQPVVRLLGNGQQHRQWVAESQSASAPVQTTLPHGTNSVPTFRMLQLRLTPMNWPHDNFCLVSSVSDPVWEALAAIPMPGKVGTATVRPTTSSRSTLLFFCNVAESIDFLESYMDSKSPDLLSSAARADYDRLIAAHNQVVGELTQPSVSPASTLPVPSEEGTQAEATQRWFYRAVMVLADSDRDGLSDEFEHHLGSSRWQADTDGDGADDGWEQRMGTSPHIKDVTANDLPTGDADGDGIVNEDEIDHGTDPRNPDSDGDGVSDAEDLEPLDNTSHGVAWRINTAYLNYYYNSGVTTPGVSPGSLYEGTAAAPPVTLRRTDVGELSLHDLISRVNALVPELPISDFVPESWPTSALTLSQFANAPFSASLIQPSLWLQRSRISGVPETREAFVVRLTHPSPQICPAPVAQVGSIKLTIPAQAAESGRFRLEAANQTSLQLTPYRRAPQFILWNNDFDEADPGADVVTAVADCDDSDKSLRAKGDQPLRRRKKNELVLEDLHAGFFGLNPEEVHDLALKGATITISKTQRSNQNGFAPETGEVRFYSVEGDRDDPKRMLATALETYPIGEGGGNQWT